MASKNKYDRQERLWGKSGQNSLRQSRVLLLGCQPSGVECLRNLVLPACGEIVVVDDRKVEQSDLGNNFFVTEEDLGNSISKAVMLNLIEMNEDVAGKHLENSISDIIQDDKFLSSFSVVVANELPESQLLKLSETIDRTKNLNDTKLIAINTQGFIGVLRNQFNTHYVLNPQNPGEYLDLNNLFVLTPFEELKVLADSYDFEQLINHTQEYHRQNKLFSEAKSQGQTYQYSENWSAITQSYKTFNHTPYVIILIKAHEKWSKTHANLPKTIQEKKEFLQIIKDWITLLGEDDRDSFREAEKFAFKNANFTPSNVAPAKLKELFKHPHCVNQDANSTDFWVIIRSIQIFFEQTNLLPVSHFDFPDMRSTTEGYLKIKQAYKDRYDKDFQHIQKICLERSAGRAVSAVLISECIQRLSQIRVFDYTPLYKQTPDSYHPSGQGAIHTWQTYLIFRAVEDLSQKLNRHLNPSTDLSELRASLAKFPNFQPTDEALIEVISNSSAKLHSFSTTIGSIAGQEGLKAITHQFLPLQNTYFLNGINGKSLTFELQ